MIVRDAKAADLEQIRAMFRLYAAELAVDLTFQNFEPEVLSLPGDYAPPRGALLVAELDRFVAGCVALREWAGGISEMKRLFVHPDARGKQVGRRLAAVIVERARELGYRSIRLDVLPQSQRAIELYQRMGFREIDPYRHNPVAGARYLELDL